MLRTRRERERESTGGVADELVVGVREVEARGGAVGRDEAAESEERERDHPTESESEKGGEECLFTHCLFRRPWLAVRGCSALALCLPWWRP